ncbi:MAG TPA: Fic family protein [Chlamydiales bacterium]|nr:Fic family protein [Chlamydiales bacterium]
MIDTINLIITPEMLNLIAEIDEFKGSWQQMGKIAPDRLSALKKVATIESIGSSTRIEGATLSDKEIEAMLTRANIASFESRDEQEVAGYAFVCEKIYDHFKDIPFTESYIKQLHSWLLKFSEKDVRHRGEYKKLPITIEALNPKGERIGVLLETTSPLETPSQMKGLITWVNQSLEEKRLHPLFVIGIFIVLFLAIHPFQDGNGRLSRILTTLLMLKSGYSYVIYSSLESIIESNKENYYLALQKTQKSWQNKRPDWTPWLLFFLNCLQRQKHHLEIKISREKLLVSELSDLARQILDLLSAHGNLKIQDLETFTKANRNTLKKTLALLVNKNYISLMGRGKSSFYTLA